MELFPYQDEGAVFLAQNHRALLADEMGLGKSAQAIRACNYLDATRILVICPAVARHNWANEFKAFSTVDYPIDIVLRKADYKPLDAGVQIIGYDMVPALYKELEKRCWTVMIADEAHFLKNGKAQRTKAIYGIGTKKGLIRKATYFWALTGTPMPNNNLELQPMVRAFDKTELNLPGWLDLYNIWIATPFGPKITGQKHVSSLRDLISTFTLRRKKEEVMADLPPLLYGITTVEPGVVDVDIWFWDRRNTIEQELAVERTVYKHIADSLQLQPDAMFDALQSAKNSMPTLRRYNGLQKVDPTIRLVEQMIESGVKKIVLFCVHREVIKTLQAVLQTKHPVLTLWGGTPADKRGNIVKKFQTQAKYKIFIGQVQAAGTAITLTAAHHMLFVEQSWVPAENAQAAMRCHRVGQDKPVNVQFITLPDSIDQRIAKSLRTKTQMISQLFE